MTQARAPLIGKKTTANATVKPPSYARARHLACPSLYFQDEMSSPPGTAHRPSVESPDYRQRPQSLRRRLLPPTTRKPSTRCAERILTTTPDRDPDIRQGTLRSSCASLHPTQSLQDGVGRIRDCPASWPDNQRGVTPPWCRTDKQSGPGIADLRAGTLQPMPHGRQNRQEPLQGQPTNPQQSVIRISTASSAGTISKI